MAPAYNHSSSRPCLSGEQERIGQILQRALKPETEKQLNKLLKQTNSSTE